MSNRIGENISIWKKLWNDGRSRAGMIILIIAMIIAVLGAYIRPDSSKNANGQHLVLAKKKPGYTTTLLRVRKNNMEPKSYFGQGLLFGGFVDTHQDIPITRYRMEEDYIFYTPLGEDQESKLLLADVLFAIKRDSYTYNGNTATFVNAQGKTISIGKQQLHGQIQEAVVQKKFILGTDTFGRDLLSRLMGGVIFSLSVGLISVLISLFIGVTLGAIAGYYRGWIDHAIMWLINVIWSIPTLLMVIAITLVMGKGFVQVFIAVGLTMWVEVARVVRGQVMSTRELDYIEASKSFGYSDFRIITRHILPNIIGPVIVISAANFASAILIEAGLSFLGIGTQIPNPSWGMMIKEHYPFITTNLSFLAVIPGLCIVAMVLSFMLIGNRLRDIYDVRTVD